MSSNAINVESSIDLPTDATRLGIDGEGYEHYLSPYRQTIYILDSDGQVDRTVNVRGRSLTTYGEWVSRTRGEWKEWYCAKNGLVEQLAAKVTTPAGD